MHTAYLRFFRRYRLLSPAEFRLNRIEKYIAHLGFHRRNRLLSPAEFQLIEKYTAHLLFLRRNRLLRPTKFQLNRTVASRPYRLSSDFAASVSGWSWWKPGKPQTLTPIGLGQKFHLRVDFAATGKRPRFTLPAEVGDAWNYEIPSTVESRGRSCKSFL